MTPILRRTEEDVRDDYAVIGRKRRMANGRVEFISTTISCGFDPETFAELRDRAVREGTSFREQVRRVVEIGLETLNENEGD